MYQKCCLYQVTAHNSHVTTKILKLKPNIVKKIKQSLRTGVEQHGTIFGLVEDENLSNLIDRDFSRTAVLYMICVLVRGESFLMAIGVKDVLIMIFV